jgi:hypothetical protein
LLGTRRSGKAEQRDGWIMKKCIAGVFAFAVLATGAGTAGAQGAESGMASIHTWVKVGRKTCMLDHFHDGNGSGPNKRQAEQAAIRAWAEFTAWEYGSPWGRYSIAASQKMNCSQESGGWNCAVQARPCRPY